MFVPVLLATTLHASTLPKEFGTLLETAKYEEARAMVEARLKANPLDDTGLGMKSSLYNSGVWSLDDDQRDEFVEALEECVEAQPESFQCHLALGEMYGREASSGGMLKGMALADDVLEHFERAVELDPRNLRARSDLHSFYVSAPSIVGGGADKAEKNLADFRALAPDLAGLLEIGILLRAGKATEAVAIVEKIPELEQIDERGMHRGNIVQIASHYADKNDAEGIERMAKLMEQRYPISAQVYVLKGRAAVARNQHEDAVTHFEKALEVNPKCGANYRLGLAYQILGRNSEAKAQFQIVLDNPQLKNHPNTKDARKRLKTLG
jgi:tetratricopeptide (TPR) repeat protein